MNSFGRLVYILRCAYFIQRFDSWETTADLKNLIKSSTGPRNKLKTGSLESIKLHEVLFKSLCPVSHCFRFLNWAANSQLIKDSLFYLIAGNCPKIYLHLFCKPLSGVLNLVYMFQVIQPSSALFFGTLLVFK